MKDIINIMVISLLLLIVGVCFLAETVSTQQEAIENIEERIVKIENHYNETEELSPEVVKFINNLYEITK